MGLAENLQNISKNAFDINTLMSYHKILEKAYEEAQKGGQRINYTIPSKNFDKQKVEEMLKNDGFTVSWFSFEHEIITISWKTIK